MVKCFAPTISLPRYSSAAAANAINPTIAEGIIAPLGSEGVPYPCGQ
jgi:hypothetical protein